MKPETKPSPDAPISAGEAAKSLMDAGFYATDNVDPCAFHDARDLDETAGTYTVILHRGWKHSPGRLQRFKVTVEPLDDPE